MHVNRLRMAAVRSIRWRRTSQRADASTPCRCTAAPAVACDILRPVNTHTFPTLRLLAGAEFRSGEDIAAHLGVTRATVWNVIRQVEALGVPVEKVRGLGYRIAHPPVWLDAAQVTSHLGADVARFDVSVVEEVGSTNTLLLERAVAGAPSGTVIAAELQSGGRGRRGRTWISGLGGALTFSVLWRFEHGGAALSGLSLVVGLACARAVTAVGARGVGVKWPNDLQSAGRKLGGILIELQGDALGPSAVVIGIGLNVRLPASLVAAVDQPVIDLVSIGGTDDRNELLAAVLGELDICIGRFQAGGFAALEPEFRKWHVLQGKDVGVHLPDGARIDGRVSGTADDGALIVRTEDGERRFHGGEVSVRPAARKA